MNCKMRAGQCQGIPGKMYPNLVFAIPVMYDTVKRKRTVANRMFQFDMDAAEEVVFVARLLYEKGLANAYEGNVSLRRGDAVYITPSAVCKGFLKAGQITAIDRDGAVLHARNVRPSSEYRLHLAVYSARPDAGGVVHAHPPYATAFALARRELYTPGYPEALVLYHRIPVAPYGRPSTDDIWKGVPPLLSEHDAMLLANHGALTVGADAREAFYRMESLEGIARVIHLSEALGGAKELPQAELDALHQMHLKRKQPAR